MSKLSESYQKLKDAMGSEVTGQTATYLADLGSAVERAEKSLSDVIRESVSRKDQLNTKDEELTAAVKERDELKKKLDELSPRLKELDTYKTEVEKFHKDKEKKVREEWKKVYEVLSADQKSPLYDKVQKVLQFFTMPQSGKELSVDEIENNLKTYKQYQATGWFESEKKSEDDKNPPDHTKSGKTDKKESKDDKIPENPYLRLFEGAGDKNQITK